MDRKILKEANIIGLCHKNVANFFAVCIIPFSVLIENYFLDFSLYGCDLSVNAFVDFLQYINNFDAPSFEESFINIATQLTDELHYLHSNQIAHRDLKP